MFTGLVEEVGTILHVEDAGDGKIFTIGASAILEDAKPDASICVNGVCLTLTSHTADTFNVTAIAETLGKTVIGELITGMRVNLERAVRLSDRLGGHMVQGHVDTTGLVTSIIENHQGIEIWISFPTSYRKWLIPVGSITVNGVSLTVAELGDEAFKVALIPHTLQKTTLSTLRVGSAVNLEFDLVAKYLENFVKL